MSKLILCLDFDGVCHLYLSKWVDAVTIPDPPVPGLWEFLYQAQEKFRVVIYSSRSKTPEGIEAMKAWFKRHFDRQKIPNASSPIFPVDLDAIEYASEKPPAFLTLDDRGLCFTGVWPKVDELVAFKPWNKK